MNQNAEQQCQLEELFKTPERNAFIASYISHRCLVPLAEVSRIGKTAIDDFLANGVRNFFFIGCCALSTCKDSFYLPLLDYLLELKKKRDIRVGSILNYRKHSPAFNEFDRSWLIAKDSAIFYKQIACGAQYILCSYTPQQQKQSALLNAMRSANQNVVIRNIDQEYSHESSSFLLKHIAHGDLDIERLYLQVHAQLRPIGQKQLEELLWKVSK